MHALPDRAHFSPLLKVITMSLSIANYLKPVVLDLN
jgi:hypothetical protein